MRKRAEREPVLSHRENAASLRTRAAAIREEIAAHERAAQEQRDANETAAREAQTLEDHAAELDLEQERLDRAALARSQADTADAAAAERDTQARRLNVAMLDAAIRAARFDAQIAGEIAERRYALKQQANEATEAGDACAIFEAERELGLLPVVETRLRGEADAQRQRANELNDQAAEVEAEADEFRKSASALRRWADIDTLSATQPPPTDDEKPKRTYLLLDLTNCRSDALKVIQQTPDLHQQDAEAAATVFELDVRQRREALIAEAHASTVAQLEKVATLVARARDAAEADADRHGRLSDFLPLGDPSRKRSTYPGVRDELGRAITEYRALTGFELPACSLLLNTTLDYVGDIIALAVAATDEIDQERAVLLQAP